MRLIVVENEAELGKIGAGILLDALRAKPHCVMGLATGSTPLPVYAELAKSHRENGADFSQARTFNLDEYVGLAASHAQSYRRFMDENLFKHINIARSNTHVPDGMAADPHAHCVEYEKAIEEAGGIDWQVLGIGSNGHIGFNEPGTAFDSRTHCVKLDERTRRDNARFFSSIDEVPHRAITMGIGTILEAKHILMLASGVGKAGIIAKAFEGSITPQVPASILHTHPSFTAVLTREAAISLTRTKYHA